jgi:hypothetical protein
MNMLEQYVRVTNELRVYANEHPALGAVIFRLLETYEGTSALMAIWKKAPTVRSYNEFTKWSRMTDLTRVEKNLLLEVLKEYK